MTVLALSSFGTINYIIKLKNIIKPIQQKVLSVVTAVFNILHVGDEKILGTHYLIIKTSLFDVTVILYICNE